MRARNLFPRSGGALNFDRKERAKRPFNSMLAFFGAFQNHNKTFFLSPRGRRRRPNNKRKEGRFCVCSAVVVFEGSNRNEWGSVILLLLFRETRKGHRKSVEMHTENSFKMGSTAALLSTNIIRANIRQQVRFRSIWKTQNQRRRRFIFVSGIVSIRPNCRGHGIKFTTGLLPSFQKHKRGACFS